MPTYMEFTENGSLDQHGMMKHEAGQKGENIQPFVDIYAEILTLHDEIQLLGVMLTNRLNQMEEALTPWYKRLWRKAWRYITSQLH